MVDAPVPEAYIVDAGDAREVLQMQGVSKMQLKSSDSDYLEHVDRWLKC